MLILPEKDLKRLREEEKVGDKKRGESEGRANVPKRKNSPVHLRKKVGLGSDTFAPIILAGC